MKRYEKRRLQADAEVDELLKTDQGRTAYWEQIRVRGQSESMIGLLESTLHLPGDVIECGVYRGKSLQWIARVMADRAPEKTVFACDSYEGFPEEDVGRVDLGPLRFLARVRKKFRLATDTPARLERFFWLFGVRGEIVKGYFSDTLPRFAETRFCFVHLDCDLYSSYKECLELLYENLTPGGVVVFDDYRAPKWPGAELAVDEFFASRPESIELSSHRAVPAWYVRK
jgi:predicted O-methyltransferase YrrM